jgi:hypothetical protein
LELVFSFTKNFGTCRRREKIDVVFPSIRVHKTGYFAGSVARVA